MSPAGGAAGRGPPRRPPPAVEPPWFQSIVAGFRADVLKIIQEEIAARLDGPRGIVHVLTTQEDHDRRIGELEAWRDGRREARHARWRDAAVGGIVVALLIELILWALRSLAAG